MKNIKNFEGYFNNLFLKKYNAEKLKKFFNDQSYSDFWNVCLEITDEIGADRMIFTFNNSAGLFILEEKNDRFDIKDLSFLRMTMDEILERSGKFATISVVVMGIHNTANSYSVLEEVAERLMDMTECFSDYTIRSDNLWNTSIILRF